MALLVAFVLGLAQRALAEVTPSPHCRSLFMATKALGAEGEDWRDSVVVLDTNIILNDWEAIFHFRGAIVVVPLTVVGELDAKKRHEGAVGYNARAFSRYFSKLQESGRNLRDGIDLGDGGRLIFVMTPARSPLPRELTLDSPDNQILAVTRFLQNENPGRQVYMISEDMNARTKADLLGLSTMGFRIPEVRHGGEKKKTQYEEWTMSIAEEQEWTSRGALQLPAELQGVVLANEFVRLRRPTKGDEDRGEFAIFKEETGELRKLKIYSAKKGLPIEPKNEEQLLALELLMDDSIDLVSLSGKAGTGKTLLALAVALKKVLWDYNSDGRYEEVILARSEIPTGEDPGALPGSAEQKILPYMDGYLDNLSFIGRSAYARGWSLGGIKKETPSTDEEASEERPTRARRGSLAGARGAPRMPLPKLEPSSFSRGEDWWSTSRNLDSYSLAILMSGKVKIQPLSFVRGRTLPNRIIIIDEAQNLRAAQIKTLVTRAGEGSRVILIGDTRQVDSPYLNDENNGLADLIARFRGASIHGNMKLVRSERSRLAEIATGLYGDD